MLPSGNRSSVYLPAQIPRKSIRLPCPGTPSSGATFFPVINATSDNTTITGSPEKILSAERPVLVALETPRECGSDGCVVAMA
ncbi:hypothetical protein BH10PLA2_BH10PLA2_32250 [soil metagenome]